MKAEITSFNSSFFEYLCGFVWFDQDRLEALMKRYPIGVTEQGEPIFWHINSEHKIANGRIITMDRETGKVYDAVGTTRMGDRLACLVSTCSTASPPGRLHW